jgi:hypothetical protein
VLDIADDLPSSLMFLGVLIKLERERPGGEDLLEILCWVALCRACVFRSHCSQAEVVGEKSYLLAPSIAEA